MVTCMGETILDIVFRNDEPRAAVPGGSSFNSAVSMARAGGNVRFVGYAGNDAVGQRILKFLRDNGLSTKYFTLRDDEKSAISLAFLDEWDDAHYQFYKAKPSAYDSFHVPTFSEGDALLFGSYFSICAGTRAMVKQVLESAHDAGALLYYDINFRRPHLHELDALLPAIHENYRLASIVRGSADDFDIMYGTRDAETIYHKHIAPYCPVFICTCGSVGVTVCTQAGIQKFPTPQIETVSTIGAGDNFNAGILTELMAQGIKPSQLQTLDWTPFVARGQRFAAAVCATIENYISADANL